MADNIGINIPLTPIKDAKKALEQVKSLVDDLNRTSLNLRLDKANIGREINSIKKDLDKALAEKAKIELQLGDTKEIDKQIDAIKKRLADATRQEHDIQANIKVNDAALKIAKQDLKDLETEAKAAEQAAKQAEQAIRKADQVTKQQAKAVAQEAAQQMRDNATKRGAEQARQVYKETLQELNNLNNKGVTIETSQAKKSIGALKQEIESLGKTRIELKAQFDDVNEKIKVVQRGIERLRNVKGQIRLENGDVVVAEEYVQKLRERLTELKKQRYDIAARVDVNDDELELLNNLLGEAKKKADQLRDALSSVGSFGQSLSNLGSGLQSIGNAFGGNFLSKVATTLTAYGTIMATQGLSSATARYDTFTTFPKLMEQIGYSTSDAEAAVNKMNEAVQGLPTGLNEIVESSKQYILALNDIEKGTDLAIAANNAFLANASDSSQVYQGMRQIQDILSKGELRSTEWQSLFTALGTSIQPIAQELGYGADEVARFKSELAEGAIEANDFVDALIRAGTGTGALVERANIQKETLDATISNIKNAFSIMGYQILDELNNVLVEYTGKTLPENIKGISDYIKQNITPALREWISENGEAISAFIDKIKSFDWMGLFSSIGQAIQNVFTWVKKIIEHIPDGMLTPLITFASVYASPLGKALSLTGKAISGIAGSINDIVGVLSGEKATTGIGSIVQLFNSAKDGKLASQVALGIGSATAIVGGVVAIGTKMRTELEQAAKASVTEKIGVDTEELLNEVRLSAARFDAQKEAWTKEISVIEKRFNDAKNLLKDVRSLNDQIKTGSVDNLDSAIEQQSKNLRELENLADIHIEFDSETGIIDDTADSILNLADSYLELAKAQALAEAYKNIGQQALQAKLQADYDREKTRRAWVKAVNEQSANQEILATYGVPGATPPEGTTKEDYDKAVANRAAINKAVTDAVEAMKVAEETYQDAGEMVDYFDGKLEQQLGIMESLSYVEDAYNSKLEKTAEATQKSGKSVEELREEYRKLREETEASIKSQANVFGELGKVDNISRQKLAKNTQDSAAALEQYNKDLEAAAKFQRELEQSGGMTDAAGNYLNSSLFNVALAEITQGGFTDRGLLRGFVQAIENYSTEDSLNYLYEILEGYDLTTLGSSKAAELLAGFQMAAKGIDVTTLFSEEFEQAFAEGNFSGASEALEEAFGELENMDFSKLSEAGEEAVNAVKQKVEELRKTLEGTEGNEGYLARLDEIQSALNEATTGEALDGVLSILQELNDMDMSTFLTTAQSMTDAQAKLAEQFDTVAVSAEDAKNKVGQFANDAQRKVSKIYPLTTQIRNLGTAFSTAATEAINLSNAIKNIPDEKIINFNAQQSGTVPAGWRPSAYMASGGYARGTDTVPAMLTPGEFVIQKKAVDFYGEPFFDKLNSLNYMDAFDSLWASMYEKAAGDTINNYYDNHATVNQNFYGDTGQGFSQRLALRSIGTL